VATRYKTAMDDEWVTWGKAHLIACCDCGLVHLMRSRVRNGKVEVAARRMPQHTGGRRSGMKRRKQNAET
jgi:hypothetical protein